MTTYIIAGSRTITDYTMVERVIDNLNLEITEVVCGMARGVDLLGKKYADKRNIKVKEFPAQWDLLGKSAGYIRNKQMAEYTKGRNGGLILIWDGKSKGSGHMKNIARKLELPIYEYIINITID